MGLFSDTYEDKDGYLRYKKTRRLVHREVAHEELYTPYRDRYHLPFGSYVAHHKNLNKKDNRAQNLELLTETEHKRLHMRLRNNPELEHRARYGYDDRGLIGKLAYHVLFK